MKRLPFFLVSLNFDYFFKKVFKNEHIAKSFLEDFLNVKIEEIEFLGTHFNVTDKAVKVKFDFRCKINNEYVVIEMQRSYLLDVVKRFYMYFAMGTPLQMEVVDKLKEEEEQSLFEKTGKRSEIKNKYKYVKPHIVIVWMAHDSLKFEQSIVKYTVLPEVILDFVKDEVLWNTNLENLQEKRQQLLTIVDNEEKELLFLRKNKLIFAFQKRIVKDEAIPPMIRRWFRFAELTSDKYNVENDFVEFKNDKIFQEMIRILKTDKMEMPELDLAEELAKERYHLKLEVEHEKQEAIDLAVKQALEELEDELKRKAEELFQKKKDIIIAAEREKIAEEKEKIVEEIAQEKEKIAQEKARAEQEKEKIAQEKARAEQEKEKIAQEKARAEQEKEKIAQLLSKKEQEAIKDKVKSISKMLAFGLKLEEIADFTNSTLEEVQHYMSIINNPKP